MWSSFAPVRNRSTQIGKIAWPEYLTNRKFGENGSVSPEKVMQLQKRSKSGVISLAEMYNIPANFSQMLAGLDDDELEDEYDRPQILEKEEIEVRRAMRRDSLAEDPSYNADLVHWCRQDYWDYDEAAAVFGQKS